MEQPSAARQPRAFGPEHHQGSGGSRRHPADARQSRERQERRQSGNGDQALQAFWRQPEGLARHADGLRLAQASKKAASIKVKPVREPAPA